MQMRNKAVNYYNLKDDILIFYEIGNNPRFNPYRYIYYDKQVKIADDSINTAVSDTNSTSLSPH